MVAPLDPVIAQIIPLLPLRDPQTMTPQSAREALRALAAARAHVPPPPGQDNAGRHVQGAAGATRRAGLSRSPKIRRRPSCSSMAAAGSPATSKPTTGRRAISRSKPAPSSSLSIIGGRPKCVSRGVRGCLRRGARCCNPHQGVRRRPDRLGVAGDSAGGNLAAASAIACRDAGIRLAGQMLVYPVTDAAGHFADAGENARFPSRSENADGYFLSRAVMEWFCGHYLAGQAARRRLARLAAARREPRRSRTGGGLHGLVRSAARRGRRPMRRRCGPPMCRPRTIEGFGLIHGYFGLGEASDTAKAEAQRAAPTSNRCWREGRETNTGMREK